MIGVSLLIDIASCTSCPHPETKEIYIGENVSLAGLLICLIYMLVLTALCYCIKKDPSNKYFDGSAEI